MRPSIGVLCASLAACAGDAPPALDGARALVPATGVHARTASRTIYLNRAGVTIEPGTNDAAANRSTIVTRSTPIPAWSPSADAWDATVACIADRFAPFRLDIVTSEPLGIPHIEAVFADEPTRLELPAGVVGVSPFARDCGVIEGSIVFTFTDELGDDPQQICEAQAQEIAHSFGLDHVLLASDLMTYLPYDGERIFEEQLAECGEDRARPCGLAGAPCRDRQSSFALLRERVGLRDEPPETTDGCSASTAPGLAMLVVCWRIRRRRARRAAVDPTVRFWDWRSRDRTARRAPGV